MKYYAFASVCYLIVMLLTFFDYSRKSSWFLPISLFFNTCGTLAWFLLVKQLNEQQKILIHSVYWDFMILVIGYCIPLILFKFNFTYLQIIGLIMTIAGMLLIKGSQHF